MKFKYRKIIIIALIIIVAVVLMVGAVAYSQRKRVVEYVKEYIGSKVYVTENGIDGINTYETVYSSRENDRRSVWTFDDNLKTVSLAIYENEELVFEKTIPNPDYYGVPETTKHEGSNLIMDTWFGYGYSRDTTQANGEVKWVLYNPNKRITPNQIDINTIKDTYIDDYAIKFSEKVDEMVIAAASLEETLDVETAHIIKEILNPANFTVYWGVLKEIIPLYLAREFTLDEIELVLTIYSNATMADTYCAFILDK